MIFIIVLPCLFDLNRQIIRRSRFILHCYSDEKLNRGRFSYFGEHRMKMLYEIGKKNFDSYTKPKADFIGRFTDFNPLGKKYVEAKKESLFSALHEETEKDIGQVKAELKREIVLSLEKYKFPYKTTQKDRAKMLGIEYQTFRKYIATLKGRGLLGKG